MISVTEYLAKLGEKKQMRIIVSVDQTALDQFGTQILEEAKEATVGRHTAYRHQPHFQSGEYHGHCDLADGCQLSWTITGKRLHPNKFPADDKIPKDAKSAVAKVLGVSASMLEAYVAYDEVEGNQVILFELKGASKAARLLQEFHSIIRSNTDKNE